jgi:hypothetical protein
MGLTSSKNNKHHVHKVHRGYVAMSEPEKVKHSVTLEPTRTNTIISGSNDTINTSSSNGKGNTSSSNTGNTSNGNDMDDGWFWGDARDAHLRSLLCAESYWKNHPDRYGDGTIHWCYSSLSDPNGWWYMPNTKSLEADYRKDENKTRVNNNGFLYDFKQLVQRGYDGSGNSRRLLRYVEGDNKEFDSLLRELPTIWTCLIGDREVPYPPAIQKILTNYHCGKVDISLHGLDYTIDLTDRTQCNKRTGKLREIRSHTSQQWFNTSNPATPTPQCATHDNTVHNGSATDTTAATNEELPGMAATTNEEPNTATVTTNEEVPGVAAATDEEPSAATTNDELPGMTAITNEELPGMAATVNEDIISEFQNIISNLGDDGKTRADTPTISHGSHNSRSSLPSLNTIHEGYHESSRHYSDV